MRRSIMHYLLPLPYTPHTRTSRGGYSQISSGGNVVTCEHIHQILFQRVAILMGGLVGARWRYIFTRRALVAAPPGSARSLDTAPLTLVDYSHAAGSAFPRCKNIHNAIPCHIDNVNHSCVYAHLFPVAFKNYVYYYYDNNLIMRKLLLLFDV